MKTKYYLIISLIFFPIDIIYAQTNCNKGIVHESLFVQSSILGREIKYSVYLPSDYNTSRRYYPVLYLLHGYTDNETSWIELGKVNTTADKLIAANKLSPIIIVMPDAGLTWYINSYNDSIRYEDAFFSEFIPNIEKTYRIIQKKEFRAIGGLSMGGYGSLLFAMKHSEMFVGCLAFSAAVRNDSLMKKRIKLGEKRSNECYGKLHGDSLPETWRKNNVLDLASKQPLSNLNSIQFFIDCGDKDELIFGNSLLNLIFNDRKINHEFRVRAGKHNWEYWRQSIDDGLEFLTPIFRR